jgi:RimJ/RimL family protein N-acetyltransferase
MKAMNFTLKRSTLPIPPSDGVGYPCSGQIGYPSHLVETLTLRDGTPLTIRPICSDDYRLELDFIRGLSARSSYMRLLSPRKLTSQEIQRLVRIDYARELALIALAVVDNNVRQVGVARYAPESDGLSCDFGIVIADEWQGRGVGESLLRSLARAAARTGVPELTGLTLAENNAMRKLARRLGFRIERDPHDATVVQLRMQLSVERRVRNHPVESVPIFATPARTVAHNAFSVALEQSDFQIGQ